MSASVLGVCIGAAAGAQPIQWSMSSGGDGHYFEVIALDTAISWNDARDAAASRSYLGHPGYLATAPYQSKDLFIRQLAESTPGAFILESEGGYSGPWIGGIQLPGSAEPGGGFTWIDGSPWSFTNWFNGEPNNGAGDVPHEEAVQLFSPAPLRVATIRWNDLSSGDDTFWAVQSYVVEYIPAPAGAALLVIAGAFAPRGRR